MIPHTQDADFTLYNGDALEVLRELPEASVHCCVTSPPFFGLRDYGVEGQIGLEATPDEWVARLVDVFREVRRVLRPDGTLWVECGDSYTSGGRDNYGPAKPDKNIVLHNVKRPPQPPGLKAKDLIGTPWLLAFALRADGWWLRQTNIWWHTNCLPESAKDRSTSAHSYVFLFAPSARYFYDQVAVQEPAAWDRWGAQTNKKDYGLNGTAGAHKIKERSREEIQELGGGTRNLRSVWPIPTQGLSEAHFATMPEAVVRPCILAGTSERGCCPECGGPWVRERDSAFLGAAIEAAREHAGLTREQLAQKCDVGANNVWDWEVGGHLPRADGVWARLMDALGLSYSREQFIEGAEYIITGKQAGPKQQGADELTRRPYSERKLRVRSEREWQSPCDHGLEPIPCTVLDPFGGSGTTALVARKHGRRSVLIELSPDYCSLAARRLSQQSLLTEATA